MIAIVVLAAGSSERMGRPKQLLPWPRGETTLLGHAVDVALASTADQVVVVLGYQADILCKTLADRPVRVAVNEDWATGLASSVRAGLHGTQRPADLAGLRVAAVPDADAEAVVFLPADQPRVTPALVDQVIATYRATGQPIVMVRCGDRRAPPALFARAMFPALQALTGDQGGRILIDAHPDQVAWVDLDEDDITLLADIDTPDDYEALFRT